MVITVIIIWLAICGYIALKLGLLSAVLYMNGKSVLKNFGVFLIACIIMTVALFVIITVGLPGYLIFRLYKWTSGKISKVFKL